ncbi:hypothetical protein GBF38_006082 [Nibea albiflora]|uniref:Uncharacterized protein n=1 Tax=Nibea albiflora TaxID=240163 RepID=A0ACB7FB00_NIBAL|nr:hypothetical protein GBF38_006082 [Nibea albiflora]
MEVQGQESLGRWEGLGSRDAISRTEAMDNICQVVMSKAEAIRPIPSQAVSSPASGSPPNSDLNDMLAHLLMLSKRCPHEDVRKRCVGLLLSVQSPLFLAASCSDPGVCSTSFLHCHNLGQASSMSSSFMNSTVFDCVCWPASPYTSLHKTCAHAGVDVGAHGKWDAGLPCRDVAAVDVTFAPQAQTSPDTFRL